MVLHTLSHAFLDTAKMLPFLFIAYLLIEYLECKKSDAMVNALAKSGKFGFVAGGILGIVPQCGFSAMAAKFYASRVITLGTLLAVFISTSDEAIPIMLAQPESYGYMLKLIIAKVGYALFVGFLIDVVLIKFIPTGFGGAQGSRQTSEGCAHNHNGKLAIVKAAFLKMLNIALVLFIITFLFGFCVELLGEGRIKDFLASLGVFQPIFAGLLGLIPNCSSSVLLTQLFLNGSITFGSALAGLCANAGIGLTVLFRANKHIKQNMLILILLYVFAVSFGLLVHLLGG